MKLSTALVKCEVVVTGLTKLIQVSLTWAKKVHCNVNDEVTSTVTAYYTTKLHYRLNFVKT